ncbi:rRNA pseudouridine synthase [archaeon]|jgi:16S rRNA pseudouridine516 synthase|nr:rRNA pseudouridine synthase [archaeon]MBT4022544.1 rRNA pseudouridine synthase [archaeon]MBT4272870.1 rRNA pseudouridine synthase [archaeon]MBT4461670.1 rRNA pseudouridine synthase [archaeon]MBT4857562.1 rRNA pseudouridine synthase [archaeon]
MKLTLHRFLTLTGHFASKEDIIFALINKQIKVDDKIVTTPKFQINPNSRVVKYNDKKIEHDKTKYYLVFNKPPKFICEKILTKGSPKKSIFNIIEIDRKILNQMSAIGRLDEDSAGMIILTNDGKVNHKIASPDSNITKTYEVTLDDQIPNRLVQIAEKGVTIDLEVNGEVTKYKTKPTKIQRVTDKILQITLTEGKKREVKRIFDALGHKVTYLKRVSIGNLKLKDLHIKNREFVFVSREVIDEKILNS